MRMEKKAIYLDDLNSDCQDPQEEQANQWARDFLIPVQYHDRLSTLRNKEAVKNFSEEIGIHAGIIVGRLQHDKVIEPSWMNDLKVSFQLGNSNTSTS